MHTNTLEQLSLATLTLSRSIEDAHLKYFMKTANWNGVVIAQADQYQEVEGNVYFPLSSLKMEYFEKSSKTSVCSWKGTCVYYNIKVNGQVNQDAGWCYESP